MLSEKIAKELGIKEWQVAKVLELFEKDATIPFISRYRKEATGNLDELELQKIYEKMVYFKEFDKRKNYILAQIEEQGKLTPELKIAILNAKDLTELEDLYLPYKQGRKTKADAARALGLEPLAVEIFSQKTDKWKFNWKQLIKNDSIELETALQGARDIIAEWINEDAALRSKIRVVFEKEGVLKCKVTRGKKENPEAQKFLDYFDFSESLQRCPSHRFLAMMRGEDLGFLKLKVEPDTYPITQILKRHCLHGYSDSTDQVKQAMEDSYDRLLQPAMESEMLSKFKEKADEEAISVFALNAKQLLLAPPLGQKRILAIDPGFRTGCKAVCLNENGDFLKYESIFPHEPQLQTSESANTLKKLVEEFKIEIIAIGNATAGRETEAFVQSVFGSQFPIYMVNESGASIYSASEAAREEFPKLDVTVRGAISIGRRLMDPLAELVKIDPKSIGVGQYQHDVNQTLLKKRLDFVVESSVNLVGVNLNTASKQLLTYVSGVGPSIAANIIEYRNKNGDFSDRNQLKEIPRLGNKAFEQCAGFLKIPNAKNPLDNSTVHPERYAVVDKMAKIQNTSIKELIGNEEKIKNVKPELFVNEKEELGLPTIQDILKELLKPGLDPRGEAKNIDFDTNFRKIDDLEAGLELNGQITNITNFGAFVDIGVKQDGLVHISQMSNRFIKHPSEVVKLGDVVKVRIMEVDVPRKRINLTMKFEH